METLQAKPLLTKNKSGLKIGGLVFTVVLLLSAGLQTKGQGCLAFPNAGTPNDPPTVNPCAGPVATNPSCSTATTLEINAECTPGTVRSGAANPAASCWNPASVSAVWYKFTTPAGGGGVYRISTDNGTGVFDSDTRLALYTGVCDTLALKQCSDDTLITCGSNTSIMEATLAASTTYYIAVDVFPGSTVLDFCINVTKYDVSANDCIQNACDITDFANQTLTACKPFDSDAYTYYKTTSTNVAATNSGFTNGNCNGSNPLINVTKNDVWFKYVYSSTASNWISVYPNNGCVYYGMEAFKNASPISARNCGSADGLTYISCSLGDLSPTSTNNDGDTRNKSRGSAMNHPRLDLTGAATNGDTIFIRVWQYTRVDGDATSPNFGLAAAATDAIFNLVVEAAPTEGANPISIDGVTRDRCITGGPTIASDCDSTCGGAALGLLTFKNVSFSKTCLTNAGLQGNVANVSTCPASGNYGPVADEPQQLNSSPGTGGTYAKDCAGSYLTPVGFCKNPNYSGFYKFKVPSVDMPVTVTDFPARNLLCTAIALLPEPVKGILNSLFCPPNITATTIPALGQTTITIRDINAVGVNGNPLQAYLFPDSSCKSGSPVLMQAFPDGCNKSVCFRPSLPCNSLPPGCYTLVIDGADAQLLSYTLDLDIKMIDPLTCTPLPTANPVCGSGTARVSGTADITKVKSDVLKLQSVNPVPSNDKVNVSYVSGSIGKMKVEVYNMLGEKVYSDVFDTNIGENTKEINISKFNNGVYMINMEQNGVKMQSRIVKVD